VTRRLTFEYRCPRALLDHQIDRKCCQTHDRVLRPEKGIADPVQPRMRRHHKAWGREPQADDARKSKIVPGANATRLHYVAPIRGLWPFCCCPDPGANATRLYDFAPFGAEKAHNRILRQERKIADVIQPRTRRHHKAWGVNPRYTFTQYSVASSGARWPRRPKATHRSARAVAGFQIGQ
jgi:hypothetical protein